MDIGRFPPKYRRWGNRITRVSRPIFSIDDHTRCRHLWVIGKTGTGKSTALENWMLQDIRAGLGFAYIDPHGPNAEHLLSLIKKRRQQDVVLFDAGDREHPIGFNIF